jgi:hypothetical protein
MPDDIVVINQTYREGLGARFDRDYYQTVYSSTIGYSRVFDYSIGLGSAVSGGSGLGILANPNFAWICGIVTTASVLLSVAKGVWDWPGKSKFALERVQFFDSVWSNYETLINDLNAEKAWNSDFAKRRNELRKNSKPSNADPYPLLSESARRSIQNRVKDQVAYKSWWNWRE